MKTERTKSAIWSRPLFGETVDQIGKPRTPAQDKALLRALRHGEPYHLFPMPLRGDAGDLICKALIRRGLATDEPAPILTELGIHEARGVPAKYSPDGDRHFVNHYRCPECGEEWQDEWSCACNDECPGCGLKDIEPYHSVEAPKTSGEHEP